MCPCENSPCKYGRYNMSRTVDAEELHKRHAYSRKTNRFHRLHESRWSDKFGFSYLRLNEVSGPAVVEAQALSTKLIPARHVDLGRVCLPANPAPQYSRSGGQRPCQGGVFSAAVTSLSDMRGWRYRSSRTASDGPVQE